MAWDRGRQDWRTFRVDRLARPASTGVRFIARRLPAKDAAAYVEQSISGRPNRYEARVTLHAPAEERISDFPGEDLSDWAPRSFTLSRFSASGDRLANQCSFSNVETIALYEWTRPRRYTLLKRRRLMGVCQAPHEQKSRNGSESRTCAA